MKKFEMPKMEINMFHNDDVVTTSGEPQSAYDKAQAKAISLSDTRTVIEWTF